MGFDGNSCGCGSGIGWRCRFLECWESFLVGVSSELTSERTWADDLACFEIENSIYPQNMCSRKTFMVVWPDSVQSWLKFSKTDEFRPQRQARNEAIDKVPVKSSTSWQSNSASASTTISKKQSPTSQSLDFAECLRGRSEQQQTRKCYCCGINAIICRPCYAGAIIRSPDVTKKTISLLITTIEMFSQRKHLHTRRRKAAAAANSIVSEILP